MLMRNEQHPPYRTIERWAVRVLLDAGAIKECPEHGFMQCRADPDARAAAYGAAREMPLEGLSADDAVAAVHDVLGGIGDACPDC
jgi:hypothetical protein